MMLGIDFGTSNTVAALVRADGSLDTIALDAGKPTLPTALFFSHEDQHTSYGSAAMQAYLAGTEGRLMRSIKSLLGSNLMDEKTVVNGQMVSFTNILGMFFKELKKRSEAHLGHPVRHAMLGRPVHFVDDDAQRDALAQATLEQAARAGGFDEVQFQLEPIAAAFDFERRVTQDTTVLVVDIGGGTSDFTVVRVGPGRHALADRSGDILATTGVHIGGTDFDQLLNLRHAMPLLGLGHIGPSGREVPSGVFFDLSTWHLIHQSYSRKSLAQAADLRDAYADRALHRRLLHVLQERVGHHILANVESAKIACSLSAESAEINLDCIERDLTALLTPEGLAQALQAQLGRVVQCAQECVELAGVTRLDAVYLTGGSSALAPLQTAMQALFPQATLVAGDRFSSVAAGLAYAGSVAREAATA
ncbi:Hsp70 family protein [Rhodoferax sp.]|uniref:Hsp70 family protein n=1 Tax=Rhodoferax sp. TaxID=50421 RepID=UPI00374D737E